MVDVSVIDQVYLNCRFLQLSCNRGFFTQVKFASHGGIGISSFFCIALNW